MKIGTQAERERDAAVARADKAAQLIPAYAMLDIWAALGWDSIHFDDWYDERGYADAWAELTAAVRESRTAPAVSCADIEKAALEAVKGTCGVLPLWMRDIITAVWALHDGSDPAVYVVREGDVAAVEVERRGGKWVADGEAVASVGDGPARVRRPIALYLEWAVMAEAVARAIEAEPAVDPVEAEVAMAWAEYRKEYQPNPDDLTAAHKAFTSGYQAARHERDGSADQ